MKRFLLWILLLGSAIIGNGVSLQAQEENQYEKYNQWVIIIDTLRPDMSDTINIDSRSAALNRFRDEFIQANYLPNHVLIYSQNQSPQFQPTSKNLHNLLKAFKNPDQRFIPSHSTESELLSIRKSDIKFPCGIQVYLTAGAMTGQKEDQKEDDFIIPSDISKNELENAQNASDPRLIPFTDFEDALLTPEEGQQSIEHVFFAVNFVSLFPATRGNNESPFKDINLSARNVQPRSQSGHQRPKTTPNFCYIRILTKNQSIDDPKVTNFFDTLQKGIYGYADISNDKDGIVTADEVRNYIASFFQDEDVKTIENGNAKYKIRDTQIKLNVSATLFSEIAERLNREENKDLQDGIKNAAKELSAKQDQ